MEEKIKHILLIDDDQDDRYFFATALEEVDSNVRLTTASGGAEALEKLEKITPDLILLDLVMPGVNGISFLKIFRNQAKFNTVPVVVYTSDLSIFDVQDLLNLGAKKVLFKANDYNGTVEKISTLLGTRLLNKTA